MAETDLHGQHGVQAEEGEQLGEDSGELGDAGRRLGEEGGPVGLRVGRDPGNLGDEIPDEGDVTYPSPGSEELPHM